MTSIKDNIHIFQNRLRNNIILVAVSKGQSIEKMKQAITDGQTIFGENYLQEALAKINFFQGEEYKNLEWHFIGSIQKNKTKKIAENFQWVQSVASISIAKRLNDQRPPHLPPLNICLEVNISSEATKSGIPAEEVEALAEVCSSLPHLKLRGLMSIPEPKTNFIEQCKEYHKVKLLYEKLLDKGYLLDTLSMGMSGDWEAAIAEGATMIRIGTALFGGRT